MDVRKLDKLSSSKECANEDDFPKRSMSSGRFSNRSKLIKIRDLRILEFSMDEHRRETFKLGNKMRCFETSLSIFPSRGQRSRYHFYFCFSIRSTACYTFVDLPLAVASQFIAV